MAFGAAMAPEVSPAGDLAALADGYGAIRALEFDGDRLDFASDIRLPLPQWTNMVTLRSGKSTELQYDDRNGCRRWSGRMTVETGKTCRYQQEIRETNGVVRIDVSVLPEADLNVEGAYLFLSVPIQAWAGGTCEIRNAQEPAIGNALSLDMPAAPRFLSGAGDFASVATAGGGRKLEVALGRACDLTVQDDRAWNTQTYSLSFPFCPGPLTNGRSGSIRLELRLRGASADHAPAHLTVDADRPRYAFDGVGGSYVYGAESPICRYTLEHLRVAWSRVGMDLVHWAPTPAVDPAARTNWPSLQSHDTPGSALRAGFLLAQEIRKRRIPYCISIWRLPQWMYADTDRPESAQRRRIAADRWPQLLGCIGSYLLHARQQYGAEPQLFSFNEPDGGVMVLLTPEEHREAIKRIGSYLAGLGLKTKMLLGDVTNPRDTIGYAAPAAGDPEAMRFVGAVAFHSWHGASPSQYAAWAALAERVGRPLLVTEVGTDAAAWHTPWVFGDYGYAMDELDLYQQILLHASPRATIHWEYSADYAIVNEVKSREGVAHPFETTARFWFLKHLGDLTPPAAQALTTASDRASVLFTAFAGGGRTKTYALHIANLRASRKAIIRGIPREIRGLSAIRTSRVESYARQPPVPVVNGSLELELVAQSLVTLTTAPPP